MQPSWKKACLAGIVWGVVVVMGCASTPQPFDYHEDRDGKDAIFCVRYVQGFIDGAVATDARVLENIATEFDEDETFSERAIRSRIVNRISRRGPTVYADFCLGEPVSLEEVVEKVVNDLANRKVLDEDLLARDAVFSTLRREYPCSTDDEG